MDKPDSQNDAESLQRAFAVVRAAIQAGQIASLAAFRDELAQSKTDEEQAECGFDFGSRLNCGAFRDGVKAGIADAEAFEDGFFAGIDAGLIAGLKQRLGQPAPAAPVRPTPPDGDTFDTAYADGFEEGFKEAFAFVPDSGAPGAGA